MFNLALAKAKQIKLCSTSAKINNFFSAKPWAHFIIFLEKLRWLSATAVFISSWNYNNHVAVWALLCSAVCLRPVGLTFSQLGTLEWGKLLFWWIAYYFCKCQYRACTVSDVHSLPAGQMSLWSFRGCAANTHSRMTGPYIVIPRNEALVDLKCVLLGAGEAGGNSVPLVYNDHNLSSVTMAS